MEEFASFGEWLRRRRATLGLTRAELAGCAGCSVSALRKIEADERRPSRLLAELLAGCLRISPEEQPAFVDAARGVRQTARLGSPVPATFSAAPPPIAAPPGPARPTPVWNLPAPATPLVGREAELDALVHLLRNPECRLLTLVGPGGIGKTHLALEAACSVWSHFADGVFFAPLEAVAVPEHMAPAIARALGINFAGSAEPQRQLVTFLQSRQVLLFMDNLEHLLDGVALLAHILEESPGLKLLVTSRERLQLRGEWDFEVQGLPVPPADELDGLEAYSAVQLFLQRARRARAGFELSDGDLPAINQICRLVEGMPLALELAAAWTPVLSCEEIAAEIERGLDILATTLRDAPARQRSMRAVFDHSWKLLTEEQQRALRCFSVFRGGFRREAASAVVGAELPLISSLLANSFLRRAADGRFMMHDLVSRYAAERLAEDTEEEGMVAGRHGAYYLTLVAGLEGTLKSARQRDALAQLDAEAGNIRRAWLQTVASGNPALIHRPVRALWYFFEIRGWFQEALTAFSWAADTLANRFPTLNTPELDVAALHAYLRAQEGWFLLRLGRFEGAARHMAANLDVLRAAGAYGFLVDALQHAAALDLLMGNYGRSRELYQEMYRYALQTQDPWNAAMAQTNIGLTNLSLGAPEAARAQMVESVSSFRAIGDSRMLAGALHFLGGACCAMGDFEVAGDYLYESLALIRAVGDRWLESMALRELGNLAHETGRYQEAASLFLDSLALARETDEHWSLLQALNFLGATMLALNEFDRARAAFSEGLTMAWEMQALPAVMATLAGLAEWATRRAAVDEQLRSALTTTYFVLNHPACDQRTREAAQRLESELEERLEPEMVEAARGLAGTITLEELVTRA